MLDGKTLARTVLVCAILLAAGACTPMLRGVTDASKMLNPNKWGGQRCGNCVESVSFNPENPDGAN